MAICNLVEAKIGHELNLINHRVSWLAASQSFLVLTLVELLRDYSKRSHPAICILLIFIPLIGLALCTQVYYAVRAAFNVLRDHLLPDRGKLTTSLNELAGTSFSPLGPDRVTDFVGAIPAKWIPVTFILTWLVALGLVIWVIVSS